MTFYLRGFFFSCSIAALVGILVGRGTPKQPCTEAHRQNLVIVPSAEERSTGRFERSTVIKAVGTFRACGLVALSKVVPASEALDFAHHASRMLAPLLESRSRVQSVSSTSFENVKNEPFLLSGEALRERQSGRLDLLLPHTLPFNRSGIIINKFALAVLREIFDQQSYELKSVHAVASLPGTDAQNWHRDDGPLFPEKRLDGGIREEAATNLGVYAVNAFIALNDVSLAAGPTEYILGSHAYSNSHIKKDLAENHEAVAFAWPRGSVCLMDYRTVHRGGANLIRTFSATRLLAMLVYGRPWWRDAVNYQHENYGGVERVSEAIPGLGVGSEDAEAAAVVARRRAQRTSASGSSALESNARAMFFYCRALWGLDE
jgi:hypothetical protein